MKKSKNDRRIDYIEFRVRDMVTTFRSSQRRFELREARSRSLSSISLEDSVSTL
jgi:hypothetical protein